MERSASSEHALRGPVVAKDGRVADRAGQLALATDDQPWLLTVEQVARRCQLSAKTVYRAIARGSLRASQLGRGGSYRIREHDVEAWIEGTVVEPAPDDSWSARINARPVDPVAPSAAPRRTRRPRNGGDGRLAVNARMGPQS